MDSPEDAAAAGTDLVARGAGAAYVKLRSGGCVLVDANGEGTLYRAPEVAVVDATGAGDAFAGTLAAVLTDGRPAGDAAVLAVAAATASVRRHGSQESYLLVHELERIARDVRRTAVDIPTRR